jgi:hypothetical protein
LATPTCVVAAVNAKPANMSSATPGVAAVAVMKIELVGTAAPKASDFLIVS